MRMRVLLMLVLCTASCVVAAADRVAVDGEPARALSESADAEAVKRRESDRRHERREEDRPPESSNGDGSASPAATKEPVATTSSGRSQSSRESVNTDAIKRREGDRRRERRERDRPPEPPDSDRSVSSAAPSKEPVASSSVRSQSAPARSSRPRHDEPVTVSSSSARRQSSSEARDRSQSSASSTPAEPERPADEPRPKRAADLVNRSGSLMDAPLPPAAAPAAAPKADAVEQLVTLSRTMAGARQAARQLRLYNLRVKNRRELSGLGLVISVFRLPQGATARDLLPGIRRDYPDLTVDENSRYQLQAAGRRYARELVGWPPQPGAACRRPVRLGMVDTDLAADHPALSGARLKARSFVSDPDAPLTHGTAVASLLVGAVGSDYAGLLPRARLWAAGVFTRSDEALETTTERLLYAVDWLVSQRVEIINLSLGGSRNRVLEAVLDTVMARGIVLVAAAGNTGPEGEAVYPAAQPGVVAVTAVDAARAPYRQASRGDYIDLAAPGVDVWAAAADGGHYHSGTSFATPYISAMLALRPGEGLEALTANATDLGAPGKDAVFGWGLVQWGHPCAE